MAATIYNTSNDVDIEGTSGADSLTNYGHGVFFEGDGGADTVMSFGTGDNTFEFGGGSPAGNNVYVNASEEDGTAGGSEFYLDGGMSTVLGGAGDDTIVTNSHAEVGAANDVVYSFGGAGNDLIVLGADDTLGGGTDVVYGGMGNDTITYHADDSVHSGVGSIYGGAGNDSIDLTGSNGHSFVSGDDGNDSILTSAAGSDTVFGGAGDDTITGAAGSGLALYGGAGNDHITVTDSAGGSADTLFGGQGNDVIDASGSNDHHYISGDIGNDLIFGGHDGGDSLYGGMGSDTITSDGSNDTIFGGQGDDHIIVNTGTSGHFISGDLGNDTIDATNSGGDDTIYGGAGGDSIHLGGTHNLVFENAGDSTGTASSTTTSGDTVTTVNGEANVDHIAGFVSGNDEVVLAGHNDFIVTNANSALINVESHTDTAMNTTEAGAYASAYAYSQGSVAGAANFSAAAEYLQVTESYGAHNETYVFTHDGTVIAFDDHNALGNNDIISTAHAGSFAA